MELDGAWKDHGIPEGSLEVKGVFEGTNKGLWTEAESLPVAFEKVWTLVETTKATRQPQVFVCLRRHLDVGLLGLELGTEEGLSDGLIYSG